MQRCALARLEADPAFLRPTLRSNLSGGMPIDLLLDERDSLEVKRERRIDPDDEYFKSLSSSWSEALRQAFGKIDEFKG